VPKADIERALRRKTLFESDPEKHTLFRRGDVTVARTKNARRIIEKVTGSSASVKAGIAEAHVNLQVAQMLYDARTKAGLSQRQLADLIGSKQPVIARLEDADYEGHSLTMLQRIADALTQRLQIRFVPQRRPAKRLRRA
jgi:ribosome-binding protein aMBF1 (putative translation factor)